MTSVSLNFNKRLCTQLLCIFIASFLVRALTFYFFTQHNERYWQADSLDYHGSALCIALGNGMHRIDNQQPIFWRTPGYPAYLAFFFKWLGIKTLDFAGNAKIHKTALWVQLFLSSFIPVLIFMLAYILTHWLLLSLITAWISVFHLGLVLSSGYLLTEALSLLFLYLFFIFFYLGFNWWFEEYRKKFLWFFLLAGLNLAIYTWMRPNGGFIAYMVIGLLLISSGNWKQRICKIVLFCFAFFGCLFPWYMRNHELTGHWFFCPMSGVYLLSFSTPKIARRVTGNSYETCLRAALIQTRQELEERSKIMKIMNPGKVTCQELIAGMFAWPWIMKYPHYFVYDWMKEVCKTAFDLNASQLVAFAGNCYKYDPVEEFLSEKIKLCLYKQPMSRLMRLICWFDFVYVLWLWIGVLFGFCWFVFLLMKRKKFTHMDLLWIKSGVFIASIIGMTGGFGYARLRFPVEPLLILLSLIFWIFCIRVLLKKNKKTADYEISLQPMA